MSKSVLDVIIKSSFLTVNEIREREGLPAIKDKWHEAMTGIGNSWHVAILENHSLKIVCSYCSRPNAREHDLCQSCGAPLSAT